jgi:dissimilatory sulfite reductase (desulfoviridin) alpha/beta subunit
MAGKTPRCGDKLPETVKNKRELYKKIKAVLDWYVKNGKPKERLGTTIERLGIGSLIRDI